MKYEVRISIVIYFLAYSAYFNIDCRIYFSFGLVQYKQGELLVENVLSKEDSASGVSGQSGDEANWKQITDDTAIGKTVPQSKEFKFDFDDVDVFIVNCLCSLSPSCFGGLQKPLTIELFNPIKKRLTFCKSISWFKKNWLKIECITC